jgi:hypothetical protein
LLRLARGQSKYPSQEALAHAVGVERTAITRSENGHPPSWALLSGILAKTEVTGLAEVAIKGVWRLARRGEDPAERLAPWHETVARSHAVRYWSPLLVPGVCQTFEYAFEVYKAFGHTREKAESDARARVERQAALDREDAPLVVIMLWEAVLYHEIGGPAVMAAQCARLLEIAQRPNVLVHVVREANAGLGGTVSLASVHGEPDTLLMASVLEDSVTTSAAQVRTALGIFERCRAIAATSTESQNIITEACNTWQSK